MTRSASTTRPHEPNPSDRSAAAHHDLYENMPVMYFEIDAGGDVISTNSFGAEQLGYAREELVGRPVLDVFHPDDRKRVADQFQALIDAGQGVASWEFRKQRKDGSTLWVREAARAIETADGKLEVVVVCHDITDRKQAEEERAEAQGLVRELALELDETQDRERREIAVHLHDDVGQRLTLAHIKLEYLLEKQRPADSVVHEIRDLVKQAIDGTRLLTHELASPVLYELGLTDAIRSLCDPEFWAGRADFEFHCGDPCREVPERIAVHVYRIARELVLNVRKHAKANRLRVSLDCRGQRIRLEVEDDGLGFDVGTERKRSGKSGGIGLFSIAQRVDLLGGTLKVRSEPGRGTHATIEFDLDGDQAVAD